MRFPRPLVIVAVLALLGTPLAAQTNRRVPKDYPTIADAVAATQPGDTITVSKGTYTESVSLTVADVTLRGKGATIDARGADGIVVQADGATVTGFTIVNAVGGITVEGSSAVVTKNKIVGAAGKGIAVTGDDATIMQNQVSQCSLVGIQYVAATNASDALVDRNTVRLCGGAGIEAAAGRVVIQKNKVEYNADIGISLDNAIFSPGAANLPQIVGNKVLCNGFHGIAVLFSSDGAVVSQNMVLQNDGDGILAESGTNVTVSANKVQLSSAAGIHLITGLSTVDGNKVSDNNDAGILMAEGFIGNGTVSNNTSTSNGRDGIEIRGPDTTVASNVCDRNNGDGIDVDTVDTGTVLTGNTCRKNLHEGIDNSGSATDMIGNRCQKNGSVGTAGMPDIPDLAGTGNGGIGSVGEFIDNVYGTGGPDTPAVVDL